MKASTVLKKARKLIAETGHCKGEFARNKYRHKVDPTSPSAVKFCAYGAIYNVMGVKDEPSWTNPGVRQVTVISNYLRSAIPLNTDTSLYSISVDDYNDRDETTSEDVDKWFASAIALAKKAEKFYG